MEIVSSRRGMIFEMEMRGTKPATTLPRAGTPQRVALAAHVAKLHDAGMSYLKISNEIDASAASARKLHQEHRQREEHGGAGADRA